MFSSLTSSSNWMTKSYVSCQTPLSKEVKILFLWLHPAFFGLDNSSSFTKYFFLCPILWGCCLLYSWLLKFVFHAFCFQDGLKCCPCPSWIFLSFNKNKKNWFIIPYNIIILKEYNINIIISSLDTIQLNWIW